VADRAQGLSALASDPWRLGDPEDLIEVYHCDGAYPKLLRRCSVKLTWRRGPALSAFAPRWVVVALHAIDDAPSRRAIVALLQRARHNLDLKDAIIAAGVAGFVRELAFAQVS
jgi:hypothetical protein